MWDYKGIGVTAVKVECLLTSAKKPAVSPSGCDAFYDGLCTRGKLPQVQNLKCLKEILVDLYSGEITSENEDPPTI